VSRRIVTFQPLSGSLGEGAAGESAPVKIDTAVAANVADGYLGRLLKYIPAELVGLYLAAKGVVPVNQPDSDQVLWTVAAFTWFLVPIYLYFATSRNKQKPLLLQVILGTIAFPVWIFAVGGRPVNGLAWYAGHQFVGSIALMFVTVVFGLMRP
jgi:hypothetical protein